ncbi:MAG: hypothetical protein Q9162_001651 [Coniocarpon cinnabarinum]
MRFLLTLYAAQVALAASFFPVPFPKEHVIPGKFIVALKPDASESALESVIHRMQTALHIPAPKFKYNLHKFKGFSLDSEITFLEQLLHFDEIDFIEPETKVKISDIQPDAPYGLARIAHTTRGSTEFVYDDVAGEGTYSYIIDTGIFTDHPDFEGRATFGANFAGDDTDSDGNGHGTHCAGTVGSKTYGVAKKTNLIAVKVMGANGGGGSSAILKGIEWATQDVAAKGRQGKSVANLSLGGPRGKALNRAVQAATEEGLAMFVAAGNEGQPAANVSPACEATACTVGAVDDEDARPYFSNYGPELAVFAPGVNIESTWIDGGVKSLSGTSMATPHVTGLGAYLLSFSMVSPQGLCQEIREMADRGVSGGGDGSPDRIAYNGAA